MIQEEFKRADSIVMEANSWLPLSLDVVARVHDRDYLEKMRSRAERMQPDDLPRHGTLMTQDFGSQFFGTQPGGNSQSTKNVAATTCFPWCLLFPKFGWFNLLVEISAILDKS